MRPESRLAPPLAGINARQLHDQDASRHKRPPPVVVRRGSTNPGPGTVTLRRSTINHGRLHRRPWLWARREAGKPLVMPCRSLRGPRKQRGPAWKAHLRLSSGSGRSRVVCCKQADPKERIMFGGLARRSTLAVVAVCGGWAVCILRVCRCGQRSGVTRRAWSREGSARRPAKTRGIVSCLDMS
jgi:hypothetical protein